MTMEQHLHPDVHDPPGSVPAEDGVDREPAEGHRGPPPPPHQDNVLKYRRLGEGA